MLCGKNACNVMVRIVSKGVKVFEEKMKLYRLFNPVVVLYCELTSGPVFRYISFFAALADDFERLFTKAQSLYEGIFVVCKNLRKLPLACSCCDSSYTPKKATAKTKLRTNLCTAPVFWGKRASCSPRLFAPSTPFNSCLRDRLLVFQANCLVDTVLTS